MSLALLEEGQTQPRTEGTGLGLTVGEYSNLGLLWGPRFEYHYTKV